MVYLPSLNKWCILHPLILFLPLFFYSLTIIACHESCKECTGTSPDNCLSCNRGYALIDSKCKGMSWHYHFICLIFKMIWCLLCIYCMVKRINGSVALCVFVYFELHNSLQRRCSQDCCLQGFYDGELPPLCLFWMFSWFGLHQH